MSTVGKGAIFQSQPNSPPVFWSWATTFTPGDPQNLLTPIAYPVQFDDIMILQGYTAALGRSLRPGETIELILYWQLGPRPSRQYTIFAHLLNQEGEVISGFDANEYPTSFWKEEGGEYLMSYMRLPTSKDLPPGEYQIEMGVYNQPTGESAAHF